MDDMIFKKMKVTPGMTAALLYVPPAYPEGDGLICVKAGKVDFVHLFCTNKMEFTERFAEAANTVKDGGLFWLSYPKSNGEQKYDINRDSLWELMLPYGWHPVAQIALDETWSAIRLKRNEPGVIYEKPANIKAKNKK